MQHSTNETDSTECVTSNVPECRFTKAVTFLETQQISPEGEQIKRYNPPEYLTKSKYDIHYAITLLKTILSKCDAHKLSPHDLHFTLTQSVRKMLAMLEVERDQQI